MKPSHCLKLHYFFFVIVMTACIISVNSVQAQRTDESPTTFAKTNLKRMNQSVTAGEFEIARKYMTKQGASEVIGDLAGIAISLADPAINDSFPAQFNNFKKEFKQILDAAELTTQWDALNEDPKQFEKFEALASDADGRKSARSIAQRGGGDAVEWI